MTRRFAPTYRPSRHLKTASRHSTLAQGLRNTPASALRVRAIQSKVFCILQLLPVQEAILLDNAA